MERAKEAFPSDHELGCERGSSYLFTSWREGRSAPAPSRLTLANFEVYTRDPNLRVSTTLFKQMVSPTAALQL